jgi:hypothetical protein
MDWPAVAATIATAYAGLSDGAGATLRASHDVPPDSIVAPCAVTILRTFDGVEVQANGWVTGTAVFDVLILLDPSADVPRRYAALLRWVTPAMVATLAHVQIGLPGSVSGAVPGNTVVSLAGDNPTYDGMPYDLVQVPIRVGFRDRETMAP